jgi:hypothetical protein
MSRRAAFPVLAFLAAAFGLSALAGCTATVRSVAPHAGKPSYQIECIDLRECERVAREQCRGSFSTLSKKQNKIPDRELPGLNARTQGNTDRSTGEYDVPGIGSEEPLPLSEVVVVCG